MKRIELHMDTNHSGRLSFLKPAEAVHLCAQAGCAAVAITDFDSVGAYLEAEQEARRLSIRLLHGLTVRCVDWDDEYDLTLLAKNQEGLQNLFALFALSHANSAPIRCSVTRQQIEEHRQGLLLGADGRNGQVVRAILCRKTSEYLDAAAEGYDYLELPLEPYDISAELCRIAQHSGKILCAVQYASASGQESAIAEHALRAISLHRKEQPNWSLFQSPERLAQDFQELYRLPSERQAVLDAFWKGPDQILSLVEEFPPLFEQLNAEANRMHTADMGTLRKEVSTTLRQRYGNSPPQAISDRVALELRRVDEEKSAPGLLLLARAAKMAKEQGEFVCVNGTPNSSFLLYLLGATEINPLPRHGYCHACNHWAILSPEESAPNVCPQCGAVWETDGYDLPPISLSSHSPRWRNDQTLRISNEASNRISSLSEAFGANLVKAFMPVTSDPDGETVRQIVSQYVHRHSEKASLRELLTNDEMSAYCGVFAAKPALQFNPPQYVILPEELRTLLPVTWEKGENEPVGQLLLGSVDYGGLPKLTLPVSSALDALQLCSRLSQVPPDKISLNEPAVFEVISNCLLSENDEAAEAACALCGLKTGEFTRSFARRLPIRNLPQLARFFSALHATGLRESELFSLIDEGKLEPQKAIVCREDIYRYLKSHGASDAIAEEWMNRTYSGKIHRRGCSDADLTFLKSCGADPWFAPLCEKIAYLFPEGHSFAFALMLARLVWYTIHYPETQKSIQKIADSMERQL